MVIHRLTKHESYVIFTSTSTPQPQPQRSQKIAKYSNEIDKLFQLKFDDSTHKNKFRILEKLQVKQRLLKGNAKAKQFEGDHWQEDFYTSDLTKTVLIDVVLSEEEEEEEQEVALPAPKKFRQHILNVPRRQQKRRLDGLFNDLVSLSELEDISTMQLAAMLL